MLTIRVLQPVPVGAAAPSARFGPLGGTIGRAPDCTLVLPDPEQHISRVQAEVRPGSGGWTLVNRGSVNPLRVGGRSVAPGEAHALRDGDEVEIAQFLLRIEVQAAVGPAADPFGDLLPRTFVQPPARPGGAGAAPGVPGGRSAGGGAAAADDVWPPWPAAAPAADTPPAAARIPDDFDPFGEPPRAPAAVPSSPLGAPGAATPPVVAPAESIDAIFGLGGPGSAGDAPLPAGPRIATDAAMSDHVPEIHSPMPLPRLDTPAPSAVYRSWDAPEEISRTVIVGRAGRLPPASGLPPGPGAVAGAGLPSMAPHAPGGGLPQMPPLPPATAPHRSPSAPPAPPDPRFAAIVDDAAEQHRRDFEPPPRTRPTELLDAANRHSAEAARAADAGAPSAPAPAGAPRADDAALVAAFLQGAGLADWPRGPRTLDAATMKRLGELLRLMTQGTIELLAARAAAKREMRAEGTVIEARDNNPLKFSPDASTALPQLLAAQPARGFVDARSAVADAYDDLLAHHAGTVAGMRAAMQGLIARFDPAALEARLKDRSLLDAMLPMNRRARLWELFGELYGELSREAEDDFEALFGRAFRKAYEAQIEQLERRRLP
jgi:FHA domain-containing protein